MLIDKNSTTRAASVLNLLRTLMLLPLLGTMNGIMGHLILMTVRQSSMMSVSMIRCFGFLFRSLLLEVALEDLLCLNSIRRFRHLLESVPGGEPAQAALHVGVDDLQTVDVGGVDPTESVCRVSQK